MISGFYNNEGILPFALQKKLDKFCAIFHFFELDTESS